MLLIQIKHYSLLCIPAYNHIDRTGLGGDKRIVAVPAVLSCPESGTYKLPGRVALHVIYGDQHNGQAGFGVDVRQIQHEVQSDDPHVCRYGRVVASIAGPDLRTHSDWYNNLFTGSRRYLFLAACSSPG